MERLKPSRVVVIERIAAGATVLIWIGVLLMAAGLAMAYFNLQAERQANAQVQSLSFVTTATATATVSPSATASPTSTPTPTPTQTPKPSTPTPEPTATAARLEKPDAFSLDFLRRVVPSLRSVASPTPTPLPTDTPTTVPTDTPVPSPTPAALHTAHVPPDRIVIPAIDLDAPVVPIGWHVEEQGGQKVSVWDVPDDAAGWHRTSAYPGNSGNVVLNGHHNIRGEVFRYLIDLEPQASILLYVGDIVYHYTVTEKHILKEKGEPSEVRYQNALWIAPTSDERLTLVTCWPYTSNTHRLIVVARPYQPEELPED